MKAFMLFGAVVNSLFAGLAAELNTSDVPTGEFEATLNPDGSVKVERSIANKPIFVVFTHNNVQYALAPKTVRDIGEGSLTVGIEPTEKGFKITDGTKFWYSDEPYTKGGVAIKTIAPRGGATKDAV